MDLSTRSVATAVAAALVAVAGVVGLAPLISVLAVLVVLLAVGWPRLLGLPARPGASLVIGIAGLGGLAATGATAGEPVLRNLPLVLSMSLLLAFLAELLRRDGRPRLVESLFGVVGGMVIAVVAAGWLAAEQTAHGTALVVTAAISLAGASAVSAVPLPTWLGSAATIGAGTGAAAAAGLVTPGLDLLQALAAGFLCSVLLAALSVLFDRLPERHGRLAALSAVVVPVLVSGVLVYAVDRVLGG